MLDTSQGKDSPINPKPFRTSAYISFSDADHKYLQELQGQMAYYKRKSELTIWDRTQIPAGASWREEMKKALQLAKVAILLVSPDFFASDQIANHELPSLLKSAKEEEVIVLCVILRFCPFEDSELSEFHPINPPSTPLDTMTRSQRNRVWSQVAERIWEILSRNEAKAALKLKPTPRVRPASVKRTTPPPCDICIICAMEEEVEAFIEETTRLCHEAFQSATGPRTRRDYRYITIENTRGESLTIYATWPPSYGPEETGLYFKATLDELKPRFSGMTGICAGDREKVALGDIIVAESAFRYDTGKFILDKKGRRKHLYDMSSNGPNPDILQFARMFNGWESSVERLERHISKYQQRDWLLNTLSQEETPCLDNISLKDLEQYAPDWKRIVHELQYGPQTYLTSDRMLYNKEMVRELHYGKATLPFRDPGRSKRYIAPMASGSAVRSDNPFEEIRIPKRNTIAIDMEGATFYRVVSEFPGIRSLLVKGVSDYADSDKDDTYHKYAASVAAIYMLCFLKEYVNSERLP